jgi:hypothetical protein
MDQSPLRPQLPDDGFRQNTDPYAFGNVLRFTGGQPVPMPAR